MDIIFDLDGTLADITHRLHFVKDGNKDWDGFFAACVDDKPIQPTIDILEMLYEYTWNNFDSSLNDKENRIIICSGRSDAVRKETETWLGKHYIEYDKLYMRKDGDYTPDHELKKQMYEQVLKDGYKPEVAFDDRQRVVDTWRELGLICYQVAKGNF